MSFPTFKGRSELQVTVAATTWVIPLPTELIDEDDLIVLYAVGNYGSQTIFGHPSIDTDVYPGWYGNGQSVRGHMGRTCVRRKTATGLETEVGLTWEGSAVGQVLIEVWQNALNSLEREDLFGVFGGMIGATGEFQANPEVNNPVSAPGGQVIVQDPPSSGDYIGRTDLDVVYIVIRFGSNVKPSGPPPPEIGDVNFVNLYSTTPSLRPITTAHYFCPAPQPNPPVSDGLSYPSSVPGIYTHWINDADGGWISLRFVLVREVTAAAPAAEFDASVTVTATAGIGVSGPGGTSTGSLTTGVCAPPLEAVGEPAWDIYELPLIAELQDLLAYGLRGTWFAAEIVAANGADDEYLAIGGTELEFELVRETQPGITYGNLEDSDVELSRNSVLVLGGAGDIREWDSGNFDIATAIPLRWKSLEYAPAGAGGECIFAELYLPVFRTNDVTATLCVDTYVDGELVNTESVTLTATEEPLLEVFEIPLYQKLVDAVLGEYGRVAQRGAYFAVQLRGSRPQGELYFYPPVLLYEVARETQVAHG